MDTHRSHRHTKSPGQTHRSKPTIEYSETPRGVGISINPIILYNIFAAHTGHTNQSLTTRVHHKTVTVIYISPRANGVDELEALDATKRDSGTTGIITGDISAQLKSQDS